jgi:1-acyl-sn-glycerol-3-phosphate acyltransferase
MGSHERLEVESPGLYSVAAFVLGGMAKIRGLSVQGQENLPLSPAPFILAANHRSNWDVLALGQAIYEHDGSHVHFIAKRQLWKPILGSALERVGGIKYDRDKSFTYQPDTIKQINNVLAGNGVLGVFPERTRRRGPELQIEKRGLGILAVENRVAIATAGIYGTENNTGPIFINFGQTITPGAFGEEDKRRLYGEIEQQYTESLQEALDGAYQMAA